VRRVTLAAALLLVTTGCAAVVAGGLIMKSSKTKGQKQEFMNRLQQTNLEREKAGLKPLDWCSEAYKFDQNWAASDPECAARIARYRKGDLMALDMGKGVADTSASSVAAADSSVGIQGRAVSDSGATAVPASNTVGK
jgi:hypothetical protein